MVAVVDTDNHYAPTVAKSPLIQNRRRFVALISVYVPTCLFYLWTSLTSGVPQLVPIWGDPYNDLTDSFEHGHLYLNLAVPPQFAALADPWNPATNDGFNALPFHDLSYYHGHLYMIWGPTPVFVLFLPWRLLHVGDLQTNFAVLIFGCIGLAFSILTLVFLVDRFFPAVRTWIVVVCATALGWSNVISFLLRRPAFYEIAISCSYAFVMAGIYFLVSGTLRGYRRNRVLLGSLCLGLAAGGHIDSVLLGLVLPLVLIALVREQAVAKGAARRRLAFVCLGPFAGCCVLLGIYNVLRFGSPFEYGQHYQLAGVDTHDASFFNPGYLPPGLFYYLLAPVRVASAFPFFFLAPPPSYPFGVPRQYGPIEPTSGIVAASPIVLSLLALPLVRHRMPRPLLRLVGVLAILGLIVAGALALGLWATTERYETDYASLLVLAGLLTWLALCGSGRQWLRRSVVVLGSAAILLGAVEGAALSVTGPYLEQPLYYNQGSLQELQSLTSALPTAVAMVTGQPRITEIFPAGQAGYVFDEGTFARPVPAFVPLSASPSEVDVVSPTSGTIVLSAEISSALSGDSGATYLLNIENRGKDHLYNDVRLSGTSTFTIPVSLGLNRIDLSAVAPGVTGIGSTSAVLNFQNMTVARS